MSKNQSYVDISYAHLDQRLSSQGWLCGDAFTMADCAASPSMAILAMMDRI